MAIRPWVTPEDVIIYSEYEKVQNRDINKLTLDISRAESYIIKRTNNDFSDSEKYPVIPEDIKTAVILITEFYAISATTDPQKRMQSETFKDYSYTISESMQSVDDIDIDGLISPYINPASRGTLDFKMRRL